METKFSNEFIDIKVDLNKSLFTWKWKKKSAELSESEFLKFAEIVAKEAVLNKCAYILDDAVEFMFPVNPELQEKVGKEMIVLINPFVKKMAHVYSVDLLTSLTQDQLWAENTERKYHEEFFSNIKEAEKWLLS